MATTATRVPTATLDDADEEWGSVPLRLANREYQGRNGFNEQGTFGPDDVPDTPSALSQAYNAHLAALHTIQWKARPIPSFSQMEVEIETVESPDTIKAQIAELKSNHLNELEELYDAHALDYIQETIDMYRSKDDTQYLDIAPHSSKGAQRQYAQEDSQLVEGYKRLENLYVQCQSMDPLLLPLFNEYSSIRHDYLKRLLELQERYKKVKLQFDAQFPTSIADYKTKANDLKMRVARFLTADPSRQERMMNDFQWASRQVQPLKNQFKEDPTFAAEVRAAVLAEQVLGDPRKR